MVAEERVRLRVVFEDRHMLSKSQKSEGLKRSWLLLSPQQHPSISHLASHLLHFFDLRESCPNGLTLSMDGFVFPPFESTCILKDKDIIGVKRKHGQISDIITVADVSGSFEEDGILVKRAVNTDVVKLLLNEEFEKEGGYQSETDEDEGEVPVDTTLQEISDCGAGKSKKRTAAKQPLCTGLKLSGAMSEQNDAGCQSEPEDGVSDGPVNSLHQENKLSGNQYLRKRKAPKKLESSKRKQRCSALPKVDNSELLESFDSRKVRQKKIPRKIKKLSSAVNKQDLEIAEKSTECMPNSNSGCQLQENATQIVDLSNTTNNVKKLPSRSARRKKAKRKWLRELAKVERIEVNQRQTKDNVVQKISTEGQQQDESCEMEDDVVAVVIRPGHIRFKSVGNEPVLQQKEVPVETYHWNGITSKKKGQKWGMEKLSSSRSNGHEYFNQESSDMPALENATAVNEPISAASVDFDKLSPLLDLPKEGDIIAYRLIELSSSWTPEVSSFRVGQTSSYDTESNMILLVPVPEYPIVSDKKIDEDGSMAPLDTSLYREDGSLQIDFRSLLDVRIVKHRCSNPVKVIANGASVCNQEEASDAVGRVKNKETDAPITENGLVNGWDEISQVLSAKKARLSQDKEDSSTKKESSGKDPWPCRGSRCSALGPTVALLRSRNDL